MAWQAAIGAQLAVDGRRRAADSAPGRRTRRAAGGGRRARRAAKLGGVLVGWEMCGVVTVVRGGAEWYPRLLQNFLRARNVLDRHTYKMWAGLTIVNHIDWDNGRWN